MPSFEVVDQDGNAVKSEDFIGTGRKTIVYFYPKDNTSGCTAEACSFRDNYAELTAAGYNVVGVSKDSAKSHAGFRAKYELPFRLLADTSLQMLQDFGAWGEKKMYGSRRWTPRTPPAKFSGRPMIKLIILDFDGTLGDTRANIVLTMRQTLAKLGYPARDEETIAATIGLPLEKGFEQLFPGISQADVALCAQTYRAIFVENRKLLVPKVFPHVLETLEALRGRGYVLTIASSRSYGSLKEFLQEMGLAPYITYILGANSVTHAKPHPEPVLKTMADLGFQADETLVVGDMPVDIAMGKGAGARTCGVTYGNASRADLAAAGADFIIDDFSQLLTIDLP